MIPDLQHVELWAWAIGFGTEFALVALGLRYLFRVIIPGIAGRAAKAALTAHEALYHSHIEDLTK